MQIADQICEAVSVIVNKALEKVSYDTTITCTVVDDSDRLNGVYLVSNGSIRFKAFSSETGYRNKNSVYVQIPNGDWSQDKIIVAKKPSQNEDPVTIKRPFDNFVDITGNIITSPIDKEGLLANYKYDAEKGVQYHYKRVWSYNVDADAGYAERGDEFGGYTRLGLRASFMTWLAELGAVKGDFGLKVIIEAALEDENGLDKEGAEPKTANYEFFLNPKNMIGNSYNYESFYRQEVLIDLEKYNISSIKSIIIDFYEMSGSFKDSSDALIPWEDQAHNIFVSDISLSLGYDASIFDDNTVFIYTLNDTQYIATEDPIEDNHKLLQLRWIHKEDDGTYTSINSSTGLDYELTWYRKELGHRSDTVYSGVDWKLLSKQISNSEGVSYEILDQDWINYNEEADLQPDGIARYPGFNTSWSIPDVTKATESIKAILMYDGQPYYSNTLIFTNRKEVVSQPTVAAIQALSINCEDSSYGNYMIYNRGGTIVDQADSSEQREFKLYFNESGSLSETASQLTNAESVEWIIPTTNTMIDMPEEYYATGEEYYYTDDQDNLHIFRYGDKANNYDIVNHNTQHYRIKSYYTQMYSNNTIKCNIIKDKITYSATKELTFGPTGTSGTDYTFILDFDKGVTALTLGDIEAVNVTARLYDYEGLEVDIKDKKITWQWANAAEGETFPVEIVNAAEEYYTKEIKIANGITKMPEKNFCILEAILHKQESDTDTNGWGDYDLHAYLPIPIRQSKDYQYISGTTTICYDSLGQISSFFQNPYVLYTKDGVIERLWEIKYQSDDEKIIRYAPKLSHNSAKDTYYLKPLTIYVEDSVDKVCVNCVVDNKILWSQPVYIYQNKYPSTLINDWNGELTIDEGNNAILAAKVVAGKKESDNTFSGVMMGEWRKSNDDNTESSIENGIYGFKQGSSTFGFRNDGTAYIGPPGAGRIEFDGEKSIITSSAFSNNEGGMQMNFKKGTISMYAPYELNSTNTTKLISFDVTKSSNPFQIGTRFYVDWDGTLTASNGNFNGTITADYIYASDTYFETLKVGNKAEINNLTVSGTLGTDAIYFKWTPITTITYQINRWGWYQTVSESVYESYTGTKRTLTNTTYNTSNINNCAGYIGYFNGSYPNDDGTYTTTDVIGLRCNDSDYGIVIEGDTNVSSTIRIGNQRQLQSIYLSGSKNVLTSKGGTDIRAYPNTNYTDNYKIKVRLQDTFISLDAGAYNLRVFTDGRLSTTCPKGEQTGFYARFA